MRRTVTEMRKATARHLVAALAALAFSAGARGAVVSERWGPAGSGGAHAGALKVVREAKATRLVFDLSAMPKAAKVHHASLYCFTKGNAQPRNPARIDGGDGRALKLEAPWYRSFDATEAVRAAAKAGRGAAFEVAEFDGLVPEQSYLEVRYEGRPAGVPPQVSGLKVVHHDGQTFLVWAEHEAFRPPAKEVVYVDKFSRRGIEVVKAPGTGQDGMPRVPAITLKTLRRLEGMELRDKASGFQGIRAAKRLRKVPEVRYRVYRHSERITAGNIHQAEWVGTGEPLNAYDKKMAVISFKGEYIDQKEVGGSIIPVGCVADGKPIAAGEAIYVHNPAQAGKFYYAVTCAVAGTENCAEFSAANSAPQPVTEKLDPPKPVLQRLQGTERWYLFWAGPPYANLPNRPYHVLVDQPAGLKPPYRLCIDAFHGGFNIVGAVRGGVRGAMTLMIENQIGYSGGGNLLYNAGLGTLRSCAESPCDWFSERYFLRVIHWCFDTWRIDRARVFGGKHDSGPLHIGVRHPEIFKYLFLGNYTASYVYTWAPPSRGLRTILGPRGVARTPDGKDAWRVLDLSWYLRQNPGKDIPVITGGSNTGRDSGHTCEFGWQDDPRGWAALQRARQPFVITWGVGQADPGGNMHFPTMHPEVAKVFAERAWNTTYPAFSNCSLDDNPGNGDPAEGDPCGQINAYLIWDDATSADEPDRWEMTVRVVKTSPADECTVDVTPRHTNRFKPRKGQRFAWTATSLARKEQVQSGTVTADEWGLVTLRGLKIDKGRNRIAIRRK